MPCTSAFQWNYLYRARSGANGCRFMIVFQRINNHTVKRQRLTQVPELLAQTQELRSPQCGVNLGMLNSSHNRLFHPPWRPETAIDTIRCRGAHFSLYSAVRGSELLFRGITRQLSRRSIHFIHQSLLLF